MSRRYVLIKVFCDPRVTDLQFADALDYSVRKYFGEIGFSRINPRVVKFDSNSSVGIVSCERTSVPELQSALALIARHAQIPITVVVLRVSGTIRGLREHKLK